MQKSKTFIPVPVVASILSLSTAAFASSDGPQKYEQAAAQTVQRQTVEGQTVGYHDRTSAATQHAMDFQAVFARVEAQRQAFDNYGGMDSSSASRPSDNAASNRSVDFSTATATWRYKAILAAR
ncbi:hypothetical protein LMG28727_03487 [Paraburkholderia kirstenboschensis]|uniref:hypothetical protein n=1 Tax=Paraburkholderia kirstenboschensis TaxID=1245436 RepID=UPI000AECBA2C|nr:hypothetical protein [Paraburkholderia kirstenboschensis]CAD6537683.1 hypothetical protein LMG28727_03487 [Paraburkholderia kirstenboschensis]